MHTDDEVADEVARARKRLALLALVAFVLTFVAARVVVYLIMSRRMPDLYLYVGQTHVHHLNYGIFLLCAVGAWLLFGPRSPEHLRWCALLYGVGLALTFDEFGMWLHLGGPYWQRASFDAVVVIACVFGLIALLPSIRRFGPRYWVTNTVIALSLVAFAVTWKRSLSHAEQRLRIRLEAVESESPW